MKITIIIEVIWRGQDDCCEQDCSKIRSMIRDKDEPEGCEVQKHHHLPPRRNTRQRGSGAPTGAASNWQR